MPIIPENYSFPFFCSPGISGDFFIVDKIHYVVDKNNNKFAIDIEDDDKFSFRIRKLSNSIKQAKKIAYIDPVKKTSLFMKQQYGPTPQETWIRNSQFTMIEYRVIQNQICFDKYLKVSRESGYKSIFLRNPHDSINDAPTRLQL